MFINKEELERRRLHENNLIERMRVPTAGDLPADSVVGKLDTSKFKSDGTNREHPLYDDETRALAGALTVAHGAKTASEITGVSEGHAKVLARGEYSTAIDPEEREKRNQVLRDNIYEGLGKIRGKAQQKLMKVLNLINNENLDAIPDKDKARLAAQMANQLSGVIDRTINKGEHLHDGRSTHLHLYAPERRPLAAFEIKTINPQIKDNDNANAKSSE